MTDQEKILNEALDASEAAAAAADALLGPETSRGCDCGFAWVVIKPARGAFVKLLKSKNIGSTRDHSGGGYEIWKTYLHGVRTQSISVHVAAAVAFAEVLKENGIPAEAGSRLD